MNAARRMCTRYCKSLRVLLSNPNSHSPLGIPLMLICEKQRRWKPCSKRAKNCCKERLIQSPGWLWCKRSCPIKCILVVNKINSTPYSRERVLLAPLLRCGHTMTMCAMRWIRQWIYCSWAIMLLSLRPSAPWQPICSTWSAKRSWYSILPRSN